MKNLISFILILFSITQISAQTPFSELFTYNFGGMEDNSPEEQLQIIKGAGFNGITIFEPDNKNDAAKTVAYLNQWYDLLDKNPDFKISCFYYRHRYNGSWTPGSIWKAVMDKLAERDIPILVIIKEEKGYKGDNNYDSVLPEFTKLNNYGKKIGLPVCVYPHSDTFLESAEEALPYVKAINDPNFTLSFHVCHELRFGNGDRMEEVINKISPYLKIVTINGADSKDLYTILPLDEGDYNTEHIIPALYGAGYRGPIGLHTHLVPGPPEGHLTRSFNLLSEWIDSLEITSSIISESSFSNKNSSFTVCKNSNKINVSYSISNHSKPELLIFNSRGQVLFNITEIPGNFGTHTISLDPNLLGLKNGSYIFNLRVNGAHYIRSYCHLL